MTSIDTLLTRARKLHGTNDDVLEEEWNNMLDMEVESMMADLDAKISSMTPEELAAEEQNNGPLFTPEEEAEFHAFLERGAAEGKAAWFAQQRKKRRRGRR